MKSKFIITTLLLMLTTLSHANSYVELYGSSVTSNTNSINEVSRPKNTGIVLFGSKQGGIVGAKVDVFFNDTGIGASLGGYVDVGKLELSGGVIGVPDKTEGSIPDSGEVKFGDARSNVLGTGFYIGAKYKMFSARFIRYDADHYYSSSTTIGHKYVRGRKVPVYQSGNSKSLSNRDMVWIGVSFPF